VSCLRCHRKAASRDALRSGVGLCRGCHGDVLPAALRKDKAALQGAFAGVTRSARSLEWNQGRWSPDVEIEDGRWKVDLHGLNAQLADRAMASVVKALPRLEIQQLRVVVGKGGKGVLEDIALRSLRRKGVAVSDGDGWIDAQWGDGTAHTALLRAYPEYLVEGVARPSAQRLFAPWSWSAGTWAAALLSAVLVGWVILPAAPLGFMLGAFVGTRRR